LRVNPTIQPSGNSVTEYSYQRDATSLIDFLAAARSYCATQLAYRCTLGPHLPVLEQTGEAIGARGVP
jgi:hypothetical protein